MHRKTSRGTFRCSGAFPHRDVDATDAGECVDFFSMDSLRGARDGIIDNIDFFPKSQHRINATAEGHYIETSCTSTEVGDFFQAPPKKINSLGSTATSFNAANGDHSIDFF